MEATHFLEVWKGWYSGATHYDVVKSMNVYSKVNYRNSTIVIFKIKYK